jgi:hypothetical protein
MKISIKSSNLKRFLNAKEKQNGNACLFVGRSGFEILFLYAIGPFALNGTRIFTEIFVVAVRGGGTATRSPA